MKNKLFAVALITCALMLSGCGKDKEEAPVAPPTAEIKKPVYTIPVIPTQVKVINPATDRLDEV